MLGAEQRKIGFLFKLKQTKNVKRLISQIFDKQEWEDAGQTWQGRKERLQLEGWSKERLVVVLRRPLRGKSAAEAMPGGKKKRGRPTKQLALDLPELLYKGITYEYVVLVTSLTDGVMTIAQHYRDRGDAENNFDELKNQWGWAGFTTQDRKRCQINALSTHAPMGRIIALVYWRKSGASGGAGLNNL